MPAARLGLCGSTSRSTIVNIDHVGYFVPDLNEAGSTLEKLGFTLTPFSSHLHRPQPDSQPVPAGSGNRCAMLRRGYLEFLTPIGDTNIAVELRHAIQRYTGAHLIAFGTADPQADYARIVRMGLAPLDPIALSAKSTRLPAMPSLVLL